MKKAINRITILIGCMLIIALAMSMAIFIDPVEDGSYKTYADANTIVISDTNVNQIAADFGSGGDGNINNPYLITTAGEFVKAMKEGYAATNYRLEKDIVFETDSDYLAWNPAEDFKGRFLGNNKTITVNASLQQDVENYGLFRKLSGDLVDLNYEFNGSLQRDTTTSNYGSLVGLNTGAISDTTVIVNGSITLGSTSNNQTISAGGVVGRNEGTLDGITVEMNGDVTANNDTIDAEADNSNNRDTVAYAGGIIGYNDDGYIVNSSINISGGVFAYNKYDSIWNDSGALYAAGGIIGYNYAGNIANSYMDIIVSINAGGTKATYGMGGGVIGYSVGELGIQETVIRINGFIQVTSEADGDFYAGGLVGQLTNTDGQFRDNAIFIELDDELVEAENSDILLGDGNFFDWNKGNIWISHEINAPITLPVYAGAGINYNVLRVLGSGYLDAEIDSTGITFQGIPFKSPLYGWMSDAETNTKLSGTEDGANGFVDTESGYGEYYPSKAIAGANFDAIFLKEELNEAGDLNILGDFVAGGGNWSWLNIKIVNDFVGLAAAEGKFDPIGTAENPFRGTFDGQGHTIEYKPTARIRGLNEAGIFGVNEGIIKNLNIIFGGQIYVKNLIVVDGIFYAEYPQDTDAYVGTLAAVNRGMIDNISLINTNSSLIRGEQVSPNRYITAGGLVGYNQRNASLDNATITSGKISNIEMTLQGKVHSVLNIHESFETERTATSYAGGLIGLNDIDAISYMLTDISVLIEGEVAKLDLNNENLPSYTAGFIGYNMGDLLVQNACLSINREGNFGFLSIGSQSNGPDNKGSVSSYMDFSKNYDLSNFWIVLDSEENKAEGLRVFGNDTSINETGTNRKENKLFIRDGMIKGRLENGQIIMEVPIGAGEVFAGWFDSVDGELYIGLITENVVNNIFYPNPTMTSEIIYTRVISSIVYTIEDLNAIANFTNQGNDFSGIHFTLGANITIYSDSGSYTPIGNGPSNVFNGSFSGGNLTVTIEIMSVLGIEGSPVVGLFGYTGEDSHIYAFNMVVKGEMSTQGSAAAGHVAALVAYNKGMVGLNSPTQKTTVTLEGGKLRGIKSAGLVAYNEGMVQNVEVYIENGSIIEAPNFAATDNYAAGAIAHNAGIARNILVYYSENASISAEGASIAGGAVARNSGELHSVVVVTRNDVSAAQYEGGVLGLNESYGVSKLWMVIDDEIYISTNPEGTDISNPYFAGANRLEIHGIGTIDVAIEANSASDSQDVGGTIIFRSVPLEESGNRTFYGYMFDKETGELLGAELGISDYIFTPGDEITNETIYSVFALSKINSFSDLQQVAMDVNNELNPRIIYNLNTNITISSSYIAIGTEASPFKGIFKGNDNTITIASGANDFNGLFGYVADNSIIEYIQLIVDRNAPEIQGEVVAGIAQYNSGVIKNVQVTLNNNIVATSEGNDAVAGGIAAYNYGTITASSVELTYSTGGGLIYDGSIYSDNYAGGIAGVNAGTIGSDTLQDIKVVFQNNSRIKGNAAAGGIVGNNVEGSLVKNAYMTINGIIQSSDEGSAAGGIAGINSGNIESIFIIIEGEGSVISPSYAGGIAGISSGIIGNEAGNYNDINIGIYKNISSANIGGIVGKLTSGLIVNTDVKIQGNINGSINAGGAVGMADSGIIDRVLLTLNSGYSINGTSTAGGLVGIYNNIGASEIKNSQLNINGTISCLTLENAIIINSKAGGIVGDNKAIMQNLLIDLQNDVIAETKGTIAGVSNASSQATNVWVLANNRIITDVSSSTNTGFNSLKVVGEATLNTSFDQNYQITFNVSSWNDDTKWYSNIQEAITFTADIVRTSSQHYFSPRPDPGYYLNCNYHVSFHRLGIENVAQLSEMARAVNQNDYFYNVKFYLSNNITANTQNIIPIGTETNPFNGIFDGKGYSIIFETGSAIGAVAHSGLFGYTSDNSIIRDLILDIKEGVVIGGQSSIYTGALVGYSQGKLENVLVNLASRPRASSSNRIGGVAGYQSPDPEKQAENTWVIIHNNMVAATSNMCESCGINTMNIVGLGSLDVVYNMQDQRFTMSIGSGSLVGWYEDISNQIELTNTEGNPLGYTYRPLDTLKDQQYAVSFIKLVINNYGELNEFSQNIRTFSGFEGVQFLLKADIIINDDNFIPIGTKNNPFSGIFEGQGHKISFAGVSLEDFDYPGLFGYISTSGIINDLIVISNVSEQQNKIGGQDSVYSGLVASYSDGKFDNVVAEIKNNTEIFCVNKAGAMVGAIGENFQATRSWVVMDYRNPLPVSGIPEDDINALYVAGNGAVRIQFDNSLNIRFTADDNTEIYDTFYAYIDGENGDIIDGLAEGERTYTTSDELGKEYTALFIITNITSYEDLMKLSNSINQGLNYPIEYTLSGDIIIDNNNFVPIGGLVGNKLIKFNGKFNGLGNNITISEEKQINGVYAGIFGYLSEVGEVKNLEINFEGQIGDENTLYAGSAVGYNEGTITNLAVHAGKFSKVLGSNGESGFVGYSEGEIINSWILNYNARRAKLRNDAGRASGLNSVTILGAGELSIGFVGENYQISLQVEPEYDVVEWYDGNNVDNLEEIDNAYQPEQNLQNKIYYVSFLNTDISSYEDLEKLSEDVNNGYNYYDIEFVLTSDILITGDDFKAIGNDIRQFVGTFNGQNYRITLGSEASIIGKYAGLFGTINEYSLIKNLIIEINGTLGDSESEYVGAFAYNQGTIDNVVVEGYATTLCCSGEAYVGLVLGYTENNNVFNTWGVIASYNNIPLAGILTAGVNRMKVVGAGRINAKILDEAVTVQVGEELRTISENRIKFYNADEENINISGWYVNYADNSPISNHLGKGTLADENNTYYPTIGLRDERWEVIIIKQLLESQEDLNVLANDINIGGYDFNNVVFTLGNDITLDMNSIIIGIENSPFRGVLEGNGNTITINGNKGLFAYNSGIIRNLIVIVNGNIITDNQAAAIAYINNGIIDNSQVTLNSEASIEGLVVGAISAENYGTIEGQSVVNLNNNSKLKGQTIGGAVGLSDGTINDLLVNIHGAELASLDLQDTVYIGGAVGFVSDGSIRRIEVQLDDNSLISAIGNEAYAGGMVGRNRAAVQDSVVFTRNATIYADGNDYASGAFAGVTDRNMGNTWVVTKSSVIKGVGRGYESVNQLIIYGNGSIDIEIDTIHGNIIFSRDAEYSTSVIDGWYYKNESVSENSQLGSVSADSYTPSVEIIGRKISVVFINTEISTVQDLINLADAVNSGMTSNDIVFQLMNDIEITQNLEQSIGTLQNKFNFTFDGQGYTITISNSNTSAFGYIGYRGVVFNLNVLVVGTLGDASTLFAGGIAAESDGLIYDCSIVVGSEGKIIANTAGGVVGRNYSNGIIRDVDVVIEGAIEATGAIEINRAGGIIGRNDGLLEANESEFNAINIEGSVFAYGDVSSYAGGIVAQNSGKITQTVVTTQAGSVLEATNVGPFNCFVGGISGTNTGTISNILVYAQDLEIKATGTRVNYAGLITGTNKNVITNNVVYVSENTIVSGEVIDIAVGDDDSLGNGILNSWVVSSSPSIISLNESMNTLVADENTGVILTLDESKFYQGIIEFVITEIESHFAVYDDITVEGVSEVYLDDIVLNIFTPNNNTQGKIANARNSNTISSGSELKALSAAINSGRLQGALISLVEDIIIAGEYSPIGTLDNSFSGEFDGQGYSITISETVVFDGEIAAVFGYNSGIIENLLIIVKGEMSGDYVAGLAYTNYETIENIVVDYTEGSLDANINAQSVVINNIDLAINIWTITEDMTYQRNIGSIIYINGNGNINVGIDDVISFTVVSDENVHFAGWWNDASLFSINATESSNTLTDGTYIIELINLEISNSNDIANLSRIVEQGYDTTGLEFMQTVNFELSGNFVPIGTYNNSFKGTYNGNGYGILAIDLIIQSDYAALFGNIGTEGKVCNLILYLGSVTVSDPIKRAGLAALSSGTIENVVVIGLEDYNLIIDEDNGSTVSNLWIISDDESQPIGVDAGVIVVSDNCAIDISIELNSITFTAIRSEDMNLIFIGWYEDSVLATNDNILTVDNDDTNRVLELVFISSIIYSASDLEALATAVVLGFDLAEYEITLYNDILVETSVMIGDMNNAFAGTFDGQGNKITISDNYSDESIALFPVNEGTVKNLIIEYTGNLGDIDTLQLAGVSILNKGLISNVFVLMQNILDSETIASIALNTVEGNIENSWAVTEMGIVASNVVNKGNTIKTNLELEVLYSEGIYEVEAINEDDGRFVVWYSSDVAIFEGVDFERITLNEEENGAEYRVSAIDTISSMEEFQVFALYVNDGNSFYEEIIEGDDIQYTIKIGGNFDITGIDYEPIGNELNTFKGIFDGQGYTITIAEDIAIEGDYAGLFGVLEGTIQNLIVILDGSVTQGNDDQGVVAAVNNGELKNIAVMVNGDVYDYRAVQGATSTGILDNCWYVISQDTYEQWIENESASLIVVRGDGSVNALFDEGVLTFKADDSNAGLLFAGWVTGVDPLDSNNSLDTTGISGKYFAEFITLYIETEEQWNNLARIIDDYNYVTAELSLKIMNDIDFTQDFVSLSEFSGVLDGDFNILNINEITSTDGLIAISNDALIVNLAVIRDTIYASNVIVASGNSTMTNVVLVTPIASLQSGGNAEKIIVGETGDYTTGTVEINSNEEENAFVIEAKPNTDDNFDLRGFYLIDGIENPRLDNETYLYQVLEDGGNTIQVVFRSRYNVGFELEGILAGEPAINTPEISGEGRYWFGEDEVTLEILNIGNNYLFRGIKLVGSDYVDMDTTYTYVFATPEEHQEYVAVFELISFTYLSLEYNADRQEQSVNNQDIEYLDIVYTYEGIDGTEYASSIEAPINVGNYKVMAEFYANEGSDLIGVRTVGYELIPAPLKVTYLDIADKDYDATIDASIIGNIIIDGIKTSAIQEDKRADISLSNISFAFESSDAGTWNIIVTDNELLPSSEPENPNTYLNYWFGTEIGDIVYINDGTTQTAVTATIDPLDIEIEADNLNKIYGEENPEYTFTFLNGREPYEGDYFTGSLSRQVGEDVGRYKINAGDLSLSDNYNLTVSTIGAYLTIEKRKVEIDIQAYEKIYGETNRPFVILDISQGETEGLVGNDKLNIEWTYPKDALPREEAYTVEALFNPVKNPNYYIESDLTRTIDSVTCYYIERDVYKVNRRPITITVTDVTGNYSKIYGEAEKEIECTFSGNLLGHIVEIERAEGEDVGEYELIFKVLSSDNDISDRYIISANIETYTIIPKAIIITPEKTSKIYGEDDDDITWTAEEMPEGVEISGSINRADGDDVGEYSLTVDGLLINNNNYEIKLAPQATTFVIMPRVVTVTLGRATKIYGEQDPSNIDFSYTGIIDNTEVDLVSIQRIAEGEDVGSYSIDGQFSLSGDNNENYILEVLPGELLVEPREITVGFDSISMSYGSGNADEINVEIIEAPADITIEDLEIEFPDYSTYDVGQYLMEPNHNPNYELIHEDTYINISKKLVVIVAKSATKVKGEEDPEFEYKIKTRGVSASAVFGKLGREEGEDAGEYLLTEGTLRVSENYSLEIDLDDAVLTIEKAPIPIAPIAGATAGGVAVVGLGVSIFFAIRKIKLARIPI